MAERNDIANLVRSLVLNDQAKQLSERIMAELGAIYEARGRHILTADLVNRDLARGDDDYVRFCAVTEAVSTLIREHICLVRPTGANIRYCIDGAVRIDGEIAIPISAMVLEIAGYTELWTPDLPPWVKVRRKPAEINGLFAQWVYFALMSQSRLLRHFRVLTVEDGAICLAGVSPRQFFDRPQERWLVSVC